MILPEIASNAACIAPAEGPCGRRRWAFAIVGLKGFDTGEPFFDWRPFD
jgi:hypothetical protein